MAIELTREELEYLEEESLALELERALDDEIDTEYFKFFALDDEYPLGY